MTAKVRVHILLHGFPLCGFSSDVPADWPNGHVWTYIGSKEANCPSCIQAEARVKKKSTPAKSRERVTTH